MRSEILCAADAADDICLNEQETIGAAATRLAAWIDAAAREVIRRLCVLNENECPRTLADWMRCCERLSIPAVGVRLTSQFHALLIGSEHVGWTIYYNAAATAEKQARYLAHELAEYITREQSWHNPPESTANGHEVRHLIARRVEAICFEL